MMFARYVTHCSEESLAITIIYIYLYEGHHLTPQLACFVVAKVDD